MYFNAVLLLRAVARIGPYLSAYDYCGGIGNHETDPYTLAELNSVINIAQNVGKFDEKALFRGPNAEVGIHFLQLGLHRTHRHIDLEGRV